MSDVFLTFLYVFDIYIPSKFFCKVNIKIKKLYHQKNQIDILLIILQISTNLAPNKHETFKRSFTFSL